MRSCGLCKGRVHSPADTVELALPGHWRRPPSRNAQRRERMGKSEATQGVGLYILIGITTYLKLSFSGMVISAELLPSARAICTMSCDMLASASIR